MISGPLDLIPDIKGANKTKLLKRKNKKNRRGTWRVAGRKKDTRGKVSAMASDGGGHAPAMTDAWGTQDVDTLEGSALEWSTIEEV